MSNRLVLAPEARGDIKRILVWSVEHFGAAVRDGYEELISAAIADVAADPMRPGSTERPELGADMRSWHLRRSRNRVGGEVRRIAKPRHFILYRPRRGTVHLYRVLHDSMDFPQHVRD